MSFLGSDRVVVLNPRVVQVNLGGCPFKPGVGLSGEGLRPKLGVCYGGLQRFQKSGQTHFVTFGSYGRRESFKDAAAKRTFEAALERVRRQLQMCVYGYVVMPDHIHLLVGEPQRGILADAIKSLKQGVSRRLIGNSEHFWQKRYYDFNVRS